MSFFFGRDLIFQGSGGKNPLFVVRIKPVILELAALAALSVGACHELVYVVAILSPQLRKVCSILLHVGEKGRTHVRTDLTLEAGTRCTFWRFFEIRVFFGCHYAASTESLPC